VERVRHRKIFFEAQGVFCFEEGKHAGAGVSDLDLK
jgi:hypothetical protein